MSSTQVLLKPLSFSSDNPNLLYQIHQFILDLNNNLSKKEISEIIQSALLYLNKNVYSQIKDEIIYLVSSCFEHYPNPPIEMIINICSKCRENTYYTILTASICYIFSQSKEIISHPLIHSFIIDVLNQLSSKPQNGDLIIFNNKIQSKYQGNFIIDILVAFGMKEKAISFFIQYLLSRKNISQSKMKHFLTKISNLSLFSSLPDSIITSKKYFSVFVNNNMHNLILKTPDETFEKILPLIEETYLNTKEIPKSLMTAILYKVIKLKINFKFTKNYVNSLVVSHLKPAVWSFLAKNNIILPDKLACKIDTFPKPAAALKIISNLELIPSDVFAQGLLENNEFNVFSRVLIPEFILSHPNSIYSNMQFWTHLTTVISEHNEKCPAEFINNLADIFKNFNDPQKFNDIITEMIFTVFPKNNNGNYFLDTFIRKFDYNFKSIFTDNMIKIMKRISLTK